MRPADAGPVCAPVPRRGRSSRGRLDDPGPRRPAIFRPLCGLYVAHRSDVGAPGGSNVTNVNFDAPVTVRNLRFANQQTGWAVLDGARSRRNAGGAGRSLSFTSRPASEPTSRAPGSTTAVMARRSRSPRRVRCPPEDPDTLIAYLRRVKHVGAKRAGALVRRFGAAEVFDAIDRGSRRRPSPRSVCAAPARWRPPSPGRSCGSRGACTCCSRPHGLAYLALPHPRALRGPALTNSWLAIPMS